MLADPVTKGVCHDNNGTWYGAEPDDPNVPAAGFEFCCDMNAYLVGAGQPALSIQPLASLGVRNERYKIVQNTGMAYVSQETPCVQQTDVEFYEIDEDVPDPPIDLAGTNFDLDALTEEQQRNYDELSAQLATILGSNVPCPGDGNIDLLVNEKDLEDWRFYAESTGLSSWYDLNPDGLTNDQDRAIIEQHLGADCRAQ